MNSLIIKRKEFEIEEIISSNSYKCSFKGKPYFVKQYNLEKSADRSKFYSRIQISKSAVNSPKLRFIDKKAGLLASDFIDGILISEYILDHDFNENIYRQVFLNSYMAKVIKMKLDFSLEHWLLSNENLFYTGDYVEPYTVENDFTKTQIKLWFNSKELAEYYKKRGVLFDKTRIKDDYLINKETILMICKYYQ